MKRERERVIFHFLEYPKKLYPSFCSLQLRNSSIQEVDQFLFLVFLSFPLSSPFIFFFPTFLLLALFFFFPLLLIWYEIYFIHTFVNFHVSSHSRKRLSELIVTRMYQESCWFVDNEHICYISSISLFFLSPFKFSPQFSSLSLSLLQFFYLPSFSIFPGSKSLI